MDATQAHELNEEERAEWSDLLIRCSVPRACACKCHALNGPHPPAPLSRLEAARETFGSDHFFAKLGTRSGKDAVLCVTAAALLLMPRVSRAALIA